MKRALFTQHSDLPFSVELPGIESATENALTCGNTKFEYVKQHEKTWNDLRIRERC